MSSARCAFSFEKIFRFFSPPSIITGSESGANYVGKSFAFGHSSSVSFIWAVLLREKED